MGRGILSLKLIPNLKSRRTTFLKRKKSLMKKAYELSTLCDVQTCVFIASDCDPSTQFETWPQNHDQIQAMIRSYKSHSFPKQSRNSSYDLQQFFSDRKNKIVTETSKLRQNVDKFKDPHLDSLSEQQLKELLAALDSKIGDADGMIQFMEADYDHLIEEASGISSINIPPFSPFETEEPPKLDIPESLIEPYGFEYNVEKFMEADYDHLIVEASEISSIDPPSSSSFETKEPPELDISELLIWPDGFEYNVEEFTEADCDHLFEEASRLSSIDTPSFSPFEIEEPPGLDISELLILADEFEYNVQDFQSLLEDELLETLLQDSI